MNALEELKEVLEENNKTTDNIIAIRVIFDRLYNNFMRFTSNNSYDDVIKNTIKIYTLEDLKYLDYNNGYGTQVLFGIILLDDNDWLERAEYDGSEWWEYRRNPHLDEVIKGLEKWLNS